MVSVTVIPNGQFAENCYLLTAEGTKRTVVVDPGEDADQFLERIRGDGLEVEAIWLTHAHIDHILGVKAVHDSTGVPIFLHPADRPLYDGMPQQAQWFGLEVETPPPPDRTLAHGDLLELGSASFEVRLAPGHSPGSVCFVTDGLVIAGDVLFQGSIGRTDLPGGDFDTLMKSIRDQVLTLPDETVVYPGHGPETTVGRERRTNPFLTNLGLTS